MTRIIFLLLILITVSAKAQNTTIYSKAYGDSQKPAVIFIHGGPRGNATLFEGTTAQKLADKGFYVIVYDRRGEGRSTDANATFTFKEAVTDINQLYETYHIKKANILAHSFGGLVATMFTAQHPEKVTSLILAGALFAQQETYNHILSTTKQIYRSKNDDVMLIKIAEIEKLDKNSAEYRKQCYEVASANNYFKMPSPTADANKLRADYELSEFGKNNIRNDQAPILFYKNESKNNIDTKPILRELRNKVKVFGIYGKQDQIFSVKQLKDLKKIVSSQRFKIIDNSSHYLFVDQQQQFLETVLKWMI